jgi:glycosyltransferase involved in cell wall biosynthesis
MLGPVPPKSTMPQVSIIIPLYNDWITLDSCLRSVAEQGYAGGLEVIVVDDGSATPVPENISQWKATIPITIVGQSHKGVSAARNRGIELSSGAVVLFVDADCRLQANCLAALESVMASLPQHNYFQLRLIGDCSTVVGRSEHLRFDAMQNQMLKPDGSVRYLNTAAFAIRRSSLEVGSRLFNPVARRGEDTLLLADLIQRNELPFLAIDAAVLHTVPLTVLQCFRKDIRSAFLEGGTFALIAERGIRIRMDHRERLKMLRLTWIAARQPLIGKLAWLVLLSRQLLSRLTSLVYQLLFKRVRQQDLQPRN